MRKEMESLQSEKGKKYRGLMDEVKTEREMRLKEMQQELAVGIYYESFAELNTN
jgi:ClpP class serine protease